MRYPLTLAACLAAYVALPTHAATARDAHGTWLSADQAAIIEFKECTDAPGALCGQIVWDKDAGTPAGLQHRPGAKRQVGGTQLAAADFFKQHG